MAGPIPYVGDIPVDSVAYEVGFSSGDRILKLNKKSVETLGGCPSGDDH